MVDYTLYTTREGRAEGESADTHTQRTRVASQLSLASGWLGGPVITAVHAYHTVLRSSARLGDVVLAIARNQRRRTCTNMACLYSVSCI